MIKYSPAPLYIGKSLNKKAGKLFHHILPYKPPFCNQEWFWAFQKGKVLQANMIHWKSLEWTKICWMTLKSILDFKFLLRTLNAFQFKPEKNIISLIPWVMIKCGCVSWPHLAWIHCAWWHYLKQHLHTQYNYILLQPLYSTVQSPLLLLNINIHISNS